MVPFVLPNVLLIAEDCTTQEFIDLILPELKPVFKIQEPIQVGVQSVLAIKLSLHSDHLIKNTFNRLNPKSDQH